MISEETYRAITRALQKNDISRLNDNQQNMLEFFSFADDTIRHYGRGPAVAVIKAKFEVSRATAYQYILGAEFVFGSQNKFIKSYHKGLLVEQYDKMILAGMRSCISLKEIVDANGGGR